MKGRKNKGITLVALVMTIVLMLIVATISVDIVTEDSGIFDKTEQAKYVYEKSQVQERFDMALLETKLKHNGVAPMDEYIKDLKEKGIIDPDNVNKNEDGSYEVTTPDGWVAQIEPEEKDEDYVKRVVVEGKAKDLPVRIKAVNLTATTHDIKVEVTVIRGEGAKYSYYYKEGTIDEGDLKLSGEDLVKKGWKEAAKDTDRLSIVIDKDIEQGKQYTVIVDGESKGKTSRGYNSTVTKDIPTAEGAISIDNLQWAEGRASVDITKETEENYQMQYQVMANKDANLKEIWETIDGESKTVTGLDLGNVVVARLWDGYKGGSITSIEVKDETKPTVSITKTTPTTRSITVEVQAVDAEAGMPKSPEYKYYYKLSTEENYSEVPIHTGTGANYTIDGLDQERSYDVKVEVADRAGNRAEAEKKEIKTGAIPDGEGSEDGTQQGAITFSNLTWDSGLASVNVTKTNENFKLQYQVVKANGELSTSWTTVETNSVRVGNLDLKDQVVARLWDGRQGGNTTSITVKDETPPTITVSSTSTTTSTVTIKINVTDSEAGMGNSPSYKYSIKPKDGNYGETETSQSTTHTFSDLDQEKEYVVKIETQDRAGNKQTKETTETIIKTSKIPDAGDGKTSGEIKFTGGAWSNSTHKHSVNVTKTNTGYQLQYQIVKSGGTLKPEVSAWTTVEQASNNSANVTGLELKDQVVARLWDGRQGGSVATYTAEDETAPTVTVSTGTITSKSVVVNVTATDGEAGMPEAASTEYKYYYKKNNVTEWPTTASHTGKETSYTFDNLDQTTKYDFKVEVKDKAGNLGSGTKTGVQTGTITAGGDGKAGEITFTGATWTSGKQSVTVNKKNTGYQLQWQIVRKGSQINNNGWTTVTAATTNTANVTGLELKDQVVARLWDGRQGGSVATYTAEDGRAPTVTVSTGTITSRSVLVNVTATDGEAGMPDAASTEYKYYYKKNSATEWPTAATYTGKNTDYTFGSLDYGTKYDFKVEVKDKAGNTGSGTKTGVTTNAIPGAGDGVSTGAITFKNAKWDSSTHKESVDVTKTDTGYQIQWQKVLKGGNLDDKKWTTVSAATTNSVSVTGLELGDMVVARLWNGRQGGSTATFTAEDDKSPNDAEINLNNKTTVKIGEQINATVTLSDSQSGIDAVASGWAFNENSSNNLGESAFTKFTNDSTSQSLTPSANTAGTYYLHILSVDKAGKVKETISEAITVKIPSAGSSEVAGNLKEYQGKYVDIGLDVNGDNDPNNDWEIFYASTDRIFLISADYFPQKKLEDWNVMATLNDVGFKQSASPYGVYWPSNPRKFLDLPAQPENFLDLVMHKGYSLTEHQSNNNSMAASHLLNTVSWNGIKTAASVDKQEYIDFVIGSPTLEMWCAAWNEAIKDNAYGFVKIIPDGSFDLGYDYSIDVCDCSDYVNVAGKQGSLSDEQLEVLGSKYGVFFPRTDWIDDCCGYWLASPLHAVGEDEELCLVQYDGRVTATWVMPWEDMDTFYCVRPVISLTSGTKIKEKEGISGVFDLMKN